PSHDTAIRELDRARAVTSSPFLLDDLLQLDRHVVPILHRQSTRQVVRHRTLEVGVARPRPTFGRCDVRLQEETARLDDVRPPVQLTIRTIAHERGRDEDFAVGLRCELERAAPDAHRRRWSGYHDLPRSAQFRGKVRESSDGSATLRRRGLWAWI